MGFYVIIVAGGSGTTGASYNTLIGPNATNNDWYVTGPNSGNLNGTFTFYQVENLFGGNRNDTFHMGPRGFVSGVIYGGQGSNTLDYSGRSIGVNVSLQPKANPNVNFATNAATATTTAPAWMTRFVKFMFISPFAAQSVSRSMPHRRLRQSLPADFSK